MSNLFFKNHQITIYRRRRKGSTDRYALSATFTGFSADIQPASQERTEFVQGRFGATYDAYVDTSVDIKEGDQVVDEDGKRYSVKGVVSWEGAGLLDHKNIVLTSLDG
jgi:hypothetical protein